MSWSSLAVPVSKGPARGEAAYEEANTDALATSLKPGLQGNTLHTTIQVLTQARDVTRPTNTTKNSMQI